MKTFAECVREVWREAPNADWHFLHNGKIINPLQLVTHATLMEDIVGRYVEAEIFLQGDTEWPGIRTADGDIYLAREA